MIQVASSQLRGLAFTLTAQDGTTYYLTVGDLDATPSWSPEPVVYADLGINGPGRAVIPEVAAPGSYQLCTANAAAKACTTVNVQ